jgi:hypothetical protein
MESEAYSKVVLSKEEVNLTQKITSHIVIYLILIQMALLAFLVPSWTLVFFLLFPILIGFTVRKRKSLYTIVMFLGLIIYALLELTQTVPYSTFWGLVVFVPSMALAVTTVLTTMSNFDPKFGLVDVETGDKRDITSAK